MSKRIHYKFCPVCAGTNIKLVFSVKDQTVSGEAFPVVECADCTLRFTQDVPTSDSIAPYYQSEEYISHTNTSKGLVNRLYHIVRKRTLTTKQKLIQRATALQTGRLLDIGSGTGAFAAHMQQAGWNVTGLEPDAGARAEAQKNFGIKLSTMDSFYELTPASYDAITLWHVLEHVHELHLYIQQLRELLSQNGKLIIAVPNYTSADAQAYGAAWAAYDVPRHLYHFSPQAMRKLMELNQLRVASYKPMWYDSFYISILSSRYKNGATNWPGAFFTGLGSNLKALGNNQRCSSIVYVIEK